MPLPERHGPHSLFRMLLYYSNRLKQTIFQFTVDGIYEGDTLLQSFDGIWQDNGTEYLTYFQVGEDKAH